MFDPDTGTLAVVGHVPTLSRADAVLADLQAAVGVHIPVRGDLRLLPEPQCSALAGVDALGLPQSSEQITNPRVVGPDAFARTFDFVENDRLRLDLETPDYEAYLYIDYFDASGQVIHLAPNDIVPLTRHPPETELRIGDATGNGPALDIRIGPPFGQEIAVAFATSAPLDTGGRPLSEPAGPYLDWLRTEIARTRAATPDFRGEWAYFFVTTAPRNAPRGGVRRIRTCLQRDRMTVPMPRQVRA
ncbi:DUF4384 domain-containing protein, partial [Ovoidimarina sediminis]|uniref:DUF4384 domain-containing protein n=1 Tax=Ovoidimarina sediminis TaxID=3079856 RepID=UPI0029153397